MCLEGRKGNMILCSPFIVQTDGRTDRRTEGRKEEVIQPTLPASALWLMAILTLKEEWMARHSVLWLRPTLVSEEKAMLFRWHDDRVLVWY